LILYANLVLNKYEYAVNYCHDIVLLHGVGTGCCIGFKCF